MIVLGLNFGHDASVCVLRDGEIAGYALRERHSRNKHDVGISTAVLNRAFADADVSAYEVDYCAITSTQNVELVIGLIDGFDVAIVPHVDDEAPSPLVTAIEQSGININNFLQYSLTEVFNDLHKGHLIDEIYRTLFTEGVALANGQLKSVGWLDNYINLQAWERNGFDALSRQKVTREPILRYGFHYPVSVTLSGHSLPGHFIFHHMAHAASCFYRSSFDRAAILTHDGFADGTTYQSGIYADGDGTGLWCLGPHGLNVGGVYDRVAHALGLGAIGGAGKLMGLASYGEVAFFDHSFVCNEIDGRERFQSSLAQAWLNHCRKSAADAGYDMEPLGDKDQATARVNVDTAASTQRLFEEIYLKAVRTLYTMMENNCSPTRALCLTGGTALNCPSNSRVATEGPFKEIFVEPSCDDGGLSIGAALFTFHNLLDNPVVRTDRPATAYIGGRSDEDEVLTAIKSLGDKVVWEHPVNPPDAAATDLVEDQIIGWFEGRSECGPRALGHRSILAHPGIKANWERVNEVKRREKWRPFAPAVLLEDVEDWFNGCQLPSPYMLFTAQVNGDNLPAITHVDGSARIQTVDCDSGGFYHLIKSFKSKSGLPVVLNTSFNGPGEPIVETPAEALTFLLKNPIDAVFIEGYRVTKGNN